MPPDIPLLCDQDPVGSHKNRPNNYYGWHRPAWRCPAITGDSSGSAKVIWRRGYAASRAGYPPTCCWDVFVGLRPDGKQRKHPTFSTLDVRHTWTNSVSVLLFSLAPTIGLSNPLRMNDYWSVHWQFLWLNAAKIFISFWRGIMFSSYCCIGVVFFFLLRHFLAVCKCSVKEEWMGSEWAKYYFWFVIPNLGVHICDSQLQPHQRQWQPPFFCKC